MKRRLVITQTAILKQIRKPYPRPKQVILDGKTKARRKRVKLTPPCTT